MDYYDAAREQEPPKPKLFPSAKEVDLSEEDGQNLDEDFERPKKRKRLSADFSDQLNIFQIESVRVLCEHEIEVSKVIV